MFNLIALLPPATWTIVAFVFWRTVPSRHTSIPTSFPVIPYTPKMSSSQVSIIHQPHAQCYAISPDSPEAGMAYLSYVVREKEGSASVTAYDLVHTFVSPALRGRGIAGQLVNFAIEHARQNGHKIIPTCSYVATYMKRHTEDNDVLFHN